MRWVLLAVRYARAHTVGTTTLGSYTRIGNHAVADWAHSCAVLAAARDADREPHSQTFGGCLLGPLYPPSLLVVVSVLEGMFFRLPGLRSISLGHAQQTHQEQDTAAIRAVRALADEFRDGVYWHVLVYAYVGAFPWTWHGATRTGSGPPWPGKRAGSAYRWWCGRTRCRLWDTTITTRLDTRCWTGPEQTSTSAADPAPEPGRPAAAQRTSHVHD